MLYRKINTFNCEKHQEQGVVIHAWDCIILRRGLRVLGQPELHSSTFSKKKNKNPNKTKTINKEQKIRKNM
jgi:hypothetical protein